MMQPKFWLFKSEPNAFSIDNLKSAPQQAALWDGVRNYQARNFMCQMQVGDLGLFYHSSCKIPGVVGSIKIIQAAIPDRTALDPQSQYFDPKSSLAQPRWFAVKVKFMQKFKDIISLAQLKQQPELLEFKLLQPGNRLSVIPVSAAEWQSILGLVG